MFDTKLLIGFSNSLVIDPRLLRLCADLVQYTLKVDGLGTLDRQTQCPVPDQLCERAQTTADTEGRSVVESLLEAVVVEEDAGGRVDVREGVLSLDGSQLLISLENFVVLTLPCSLSTLGAISEFALTSW